MTKKGFFISIEGIEGSGKTTLAKLLEDKLSGMGYNVVLTREPGGGKLGSKIREILLDSDTDINARVELLLLESARADNVETVIKPALQQGSIVICDRFIDSSTAYQGIAGNLGIENTKILNEYATGGLKPDITILLDSDIEIGLCRQLKIDRISARDTQYHSRVRQGFLEIAESEPERFVVIDGNAEINKVLQQALDAICIRRAQVETNYNHNP